MSARGSRTPRQQLDLFVARPAVEPIKKASANGMAERAVSRDAEAALLAVATPGEVALATAGDQALARPLPDQAARLRIESDLGTNLLVEAGAGAGKTTEMVRRMVALVRSGRARVEQIAAVTFTRKAAAELRERFQTSLETELRRTRSAGDPATAAALDTALRDIDRTFVGTIHGFCARLLRERPLDAGIDPGFRELMANEEKRLRREYWSTHVERLSADGDVSLAQIARVGLRPGQLLTLFETLTDYPDVTFPAEAVPRPDPAEARRELEALLDETEPLFPSEEPDQGWDELQSAIRTLWFYRRLGWTEDLRFLDALAQAMSTPNRITIARWGTAPHEKDAARAIAARFDAFAAEQGAGGRVLSQWYAHRYPIALEFAQRAASAYAVQRRRVGTLSFQDLLMLTAELLRTRPAAREELGERYGFLLVDEFQDTDPVQAEVLFLLAAQRGVDDWREAVPRPGSLFVVGDPKQSIYRFRRADITLYNQVKDRFRTFGGVLELTSNFRSRPPIESFVNDTFRRYFPAQPTARQASYAPMRVRKPDGEPQGVYFYTLSKMGRRDRDDELAAQDADRVASWIAARVEAGDRAPGDFMVLTRRKKHLPTYAKAIEARNLPVQVTGAGVGIELELAELKLLLEALADPGDARLTVAVLVGLFFGLDYEQLAAYAVDHGGRFNFLSSPHGPTPVEQALATLREFWQLARREPADVVVARIVDRLGLLPFAAAGELADSRAGALLYVLEAVRAAALDGDASLSGALAALQAALETEEAEAPLEPGRRDVVRLMNLHQAKGLEAPVVILAEPFGEWHPPILKHIDRGEGGQAQGWLVVLERGRRWGDTVLARPAGWAERATIEEEFEVAERERLLYVAATRAQDELIVGSYDRDEKSPWRGFFPHIFMHWPRLELAVGSPPPRATLDTPAAEIEDEVARVDADRAARAQPTYHAASVTRRVKADAPDSSGVPRPAEDGDAAAAPTPPDEDGGAAAPLAAQPEPLVRAVQGRGSDWGTAVHGALEAAGRGLRGDALRAAGRALLLAGDRPQDAGGDPRELDELIGVAEAVTCSDLWRRADAARQRGGLLLEVPFALRLTGAELAGMIGEAPGTVAPTEIVEGVIDLAFRDERGWTVADYKSDVAAAAVDPALLEQYRAQVSLYAAVWERLTGEPVRERVLLFTADGTSITW